MTSPYISIIIPVYNEEHLLNRCLESVVSQTFSDIEIIIVDDASLDGSRDVINKYTILDNRIRYIKHEKNRGQGEARNTGIRESRGNYIYFIDADDYISIDGLAALYKIAHEYEDDIIFGKTVSKVDVDGAYTSSEMRSVKLKDYPSLLFNHSVWNKLIKRSFILNNNLFFEPPRYAEDIIHALKSNLYANKISITKKKTYYYHWDRQMENVTKQKIIDARNNILIGLKLVDEYGHMPLCFEMGKKTACSVYGSMIRAVAVFNQEELHEHLTWWRQILSTIPVTVFKEIPAHQAEFCELVISDRLDEAVTLWRMTRLTRNLSDLKPTNIITRIKYYLTQVFKGKYRRTF